MRQRSGQRVPGRTPRKHLRAALAVAAASGAVALGVLPSAHATQITGGAVIAYQDAAASHFLTTVTPDGVLHPVGLGMMAGTSPAIAQMPDGTYWSAVQANTGALFTVDPQLAGHQEKITMAPGTSPAIGFDSALNGPFTSFQVSSGRLGALTKSGGADIFAGQSDKAMAPGTSPAVSQDAGPAWQDGNGNLSPAVGSDNAMAPGTSPSVAHAGVSPSEVTARAFQGKDHNLRLIKEVHPPALGTFTETNFALGMAPGTSPAVAIRADGSFEIAFQANTHVLWVVDSSGKGHSTGLGMDPASSPSITALPTGGFEIAFQTNTHQLWTVDAGGVGHPVDDAVMAPGTSPAISAYVPPGATQSPTPPTSSPTSQATLTLTEQQTTSGPIPFSGKFPPLGSVQPGKVLSITYPADGPLDTALLFLKPGKTTSQCNDPNSVVVVGEGQTMTPTQLNSVFGTATPSFSTTSPLAAVACFSGPNLTPSFINLPMTVQFN